jgi:hypothetical protein
MLDGDRMDTCTRVPTARHVGMWPYPIMPGSKSCHLSDTKSPWVERLDARAHPSHIREEGGAGKQVAKACLLMTTVMGKSDGANYSRVQFFLGWWPLLFRQEWWCHIWYGVYGSPAVCHWRELVVFRILGYNLWPAIPRVQDPDKITSQNGQRLY